MGKVFLVSRGSAINSNFIKKIVIRKWGKDDLYSGYFTAKKGDTHFVLAIANGQPGIENVLYSGTEEDCHNVFSSIVGEIASGRNLLVVDEKGKQ